MKKYTTYLLSLCCLVVLLILTISATTRQLENDSDEKSNFFTIQKRFYDYWKDKTPEKGMGYKQFKRWEHFII